MFVITAAIQMPRRAYEGTIPAHGKGIVKTDIAMAIPGGYYGRVGPTVPAAGGEVNSHAPLYIRLNVMLHKTQTRGRENAFTARGSVRPALCRAPRPGVDLVSATDLVAWRCAAPRSGLAVKAHIDVGAGVIAATGFGAI
jgi:hypothetical protein